MKLHYYYDRDADIMYFSQGKPSRKEISQEMPNDVIVRTDPKTKKIKGFTILHFNRRLGRKHRAIDLPIEAVLTPA